MSFYFYKKIVQILKKHLKETKESVFFFAIGITFTYMIKQTRNEIKSTQQEFVDAKLQLEMTGW